MMALLRHTQASHVLTHFDTVTEPQPTPDIRLTDHHLSLRKIIRNNSCLLALSAFGDLTVMCSTKNGPNSMLTNEGIKRNRGKLSN